MLVPIIVEKCRADIGFDEGMKVLETMNLKVSLTETPFAVPFCLSLLLHVYLIYFFYFADFECSPGPCPEGINETNKMVELNEFL